MAQSLNDISKKISDSVDSLNSELVSFIQTLVQKPSLSGHEQKVQKLIANKLGELNLRIDIVESHFEELKDHPAFCDDGIPFKDRMNVVGRWKGSNPTNKGCSLILNGHADVVSPGKAELWDESPWSGKIRDGKLYGRGSCDMKSGLAAGIFAIAALQKLGFQPANDVLVESVIGEESGGVGSLTTIVNGYKAGAVIILEPTQLKLCPVQAGALTFRLKVEGRSIHACMKKHGVSALEKFCQIFQAIQEHEKERHRACHHSLYEDPMNIAPVSFGTITGGDWHSTVPEEVIVEGRYGVMPDESIEEAKQAFYETLRRSCNSDPWLKEHPPELEWFEGQFESGQTDVNDPIIATLAKCHLENTGRKAKLEGVTYGSDLRLFTNHGKMPAVLYGPGDVRNAHAVNEYVTLDEVITCTKVLALTIYEWCGGKA